MNNINEIGQNVAVAMGDDWTFRPTNDGHPNGYLNRKGEPCLYVASDSQRLHISWLKPDAYKLLNDWEAGTSYRADVPMISMAVCKKPRYIAQDISSRIMPLVEKAEAHFEKQLAIHKRMSERMDELCNQFHAAAGNLLQFDAKARDISGVSDRFTFRYDGPEETWCDVHVTPRCVDFKGILPYDAGLCLTKILALKANDEQVVVVARDNQTNFNDRRLRAAERAFEDHQWMGIKVESVHPWTFEDDATEWTRLVHLNTERGNYVPYMFVVKFENVASSGVLEAYLSDEVVYD